jgi:hypothetical protein
MNQGLQWDEYETSDKGFEAWRGPPAREVLLDPLRDQIEALGVIAGTARDAVSSWPTLRGSEALAADAWEVTYMKICWRCIQDEFGDAKSDDLSADREADEFLIFIRAMAKFASGFHRVESHFGASVKEVLAWGKTQAKQESKSRKFLQTGEPPEGGTAPRI